MAGTSTPAMAAAVSNAGALGAIGVAAESTEGAGAHDPRHASADQPRLQRKCLLPPAGDGERGDGSGLDPRFRPEFAALGAEPPAALREIYQTFRGNAAMTALLLETRPAIVSFHFGLPEEDQIRALKQAGILLFGSATSLAEAQKLADAGHGCHCRARL